MPLQLLGRQAFLDSFFRNQTMVYEVGDYLGLATGNPGDNGENPPLNEATVIPGRYNKGTSSGNFFDTTVNGYLEVQYTPGVIFGSATGSELITHWFGASTATLGAGTTLSNAQFPYPINVQSGDNVRWLPYRLSWAIPSVITNGTTFAGDFLRYIVFGSGLNNPPWGSSWYFGLSSTTPNLIGPHNFTEPSTGSYGRALCSPDIASNDGTTAYIQNFSNATFPTATGPWNGLTHWGMFQNSTGGNPLAIGALDSTVNVLTGETPVFLPGDWRIEAPPL